MLKKTINTFMLLPGYIKLILPLLVFYIFSFPAISVAQAEPLGGMYNLVSVRSSTDVSGYERSAIYGQLHVEPESGRFYIHGHASNMDLIQMCKLRSHKDKWDRRGHPCKRYFDRSSNGEFIILSGEYELLSDLTIRFKFDDAAGFNPVEGLTNADGSIVMLPVHPADGATLLVGIRPSFSPSVEPLSGIYNWNTRVAEFPDDYVSIAGQWASYRSGIESGSIKFDDGKYQTEGQGTVMQSIFSCRAHASGCSVSAKQIKKSSRTFPMNGLFSVTPSGGVALSGKNALMPGFISQDGQLIVNLEESSEQSGRQGITLMTKQGNGMSNTTVIGEYNAFALEDFFSSDGRVRNAVVEGSLALSGETWFFSAGTDSSVIRDECAGSDESCYVSVTNFAAFGSAQGEYFVKEDGVMAMEGVAIDGNPRFFAGNVSADGSIIVLRRVEDNINCDFFCTGKQSVRSIIVAVRRSE